MQLDHLPSLKATIHAYGLMADKRLGQHFLLDPSITDRIVQHAGNLAGQHVMEVGPGPGGLTRSILRAKPEMLIAVEKDTRCVAALADIKQVASGIFHIVEADALEFDPTIKMPAPRMIIANLPYNVGTAMLVRWLEMIHVNAAAFTSLTLMFQKEVADRLLAAPNSKTYGRLSVLAQWLCKVEKCVDIPAGAFVPPPKVTSTVVKLMPNITREDTISWETMTRLTGAAFGQRRKMLRQSLKSLGGDAAALLEHVGIKGDRRAEQLSVEEFCQLGKYLQRS